MKITIPAVPSAFALFSFVALLLTFCTNDDKFSCTIAAAIGAAIIFFACYGACAMFDLL